MRCTTKQMEQMLNHVDSPYIRCIGFLYLRYVCDPKEIWNWFMPYLYDIEEVQITERPNFKRQKSGGKKSTVGDFVRLLLNDLEYYGTRLPRLPLNIERDIKVKLLEEEQIEHRAKDHESNTKRMEYFQKVGNRVTAMYGDEENEVTWYDAMIDRVIWKDDETGYQFTRPKFVVTFSEYGNTETVSLGEMDVLGGGGRKFGGNSYPGRAVGGDNNNRIHPNDTSSHYKNDYDRSGGGATRNDRWNNNDHQQQRRGFNHHNEDKHNRGYQSHDHHDQYSSSSRSGNHDYRRRDRSRSRDRSDGGGGGIVKNNLLEEVKRREREKVSTNGRAYASRPATFKQSIESDRHRHSHDVQDYYPMHSTRGRNHHQQQQQQQEEITGTKSDDKAKKKTVEELAAIQEKKMKLMAKYG